MQFKTLSISNLTPLERKHLLDLKLYRAQFKAGSIVFDSDIMEETTLILNLIQPDFHTQTLQYATDLLVGLMPWYGSFYSKQRVVPTLLSVLTNRFADYLKKKRTLAPEQKKAIKKMLGSLSHCIIKTLCHEYKSGSRSSIQQLLRSPDWHEHIQKILTQNRVPAIRDHAETILSFIAEPQQGFSPYRGGEAILQAGLLPTLFQRSSSIFPYSSKKFTENIVLWSLLFSSPAVRKEAGRNYPQECKSLLSRTLVFTAVTCRTQRGLNGAASFLSYTVESSLFQIGLNPLQKIALEGFSNLEKRSGTFPSHSELALQKLMRASYDTNYDANQNAAYVIATVDRLAANQKDRYSPLNTFMKSLVSHPPEGPALPVTQPGWSSSSASESDSSSESFSE